MEINKIETEKGFTYISFIDNSGNKCSISDDESGNELIHFGIDEPKPKILARSAEKFGVKTDKTIGWIDYKLPIEVMVNTRMKLTVNQVRELLPILQRFAAKGEL